MTSTSAKTSGAPPLEFTPLDRHFADYIGGLSPGNAEVKLAATLVSYGRSLGHICLDLHAFLGPASEPALLSLVNGPIPKPAAWISSLRASPAVGEPGEFKPLILDPAGRLYLHRYWQYESDLAARLKTRATASAGSIDPKVLRDGLARLFPAATPGNIDWQMTAAFAALRRGLCVISGGPGTGKTRTVVVLLALMLEQKPDLRIALAAPTGKAAARLQESVKGTTLACLAGIRERLPQEASTLHRLLGSIPDSAFFRHNADNPLPLDVVVVDEASMVDLALMAKLVSALLPAARLILLGDKDQLASVEAGAVLADICGAQEERAFSKQFRNDFALLTEAAFPAGGTQAAESALGDCIVELRKNYRFGDTNGIYRLSQAVNGADPDRALQVLSEANSSGAHDLRSRSLPSPEALIGQLRPLVLESFSPYLRTKEPVEALKLLSRFRILSPLRGSPYGVENLNMLVEEILCEAGLIPGRGTFYSGRPIMVTRNDYNLKLFNGDIGLILPDPVTGQLRAWFPATEGTTVRSHLPLRLPQHETAYALTVHKSQGSEFERVLLILPSEDTRILTRELVYTGLTRASNQVEVWFDPLLLRTAIGRKTLRRSGLRDALWGA